VTTPQLDEEAIFHFARRLPPDLRDQYLDQVCAGESSFRSRVDELLRHEASDFLRPHDDDPITSPLRGDGEHPHIDRYKLLQRIGEGGFGIVYLAEQQTPVKRKVALKVIKPGMDTRTVVARFEAERQALAMLDHPHIAKVLDGGATDDGRPYFVMELVSGVAITQYCDDNMLSLGDRLALFINVCQAVQHAHQKGIIHRDLKPSNVMVTLHDGKPVVKVIDFGVAKAINCELTEKTLFTAYGQLIGTPQYMSPEQAEMSDLGIDTRTDIYALGVMLYELLTGTTPLEAETLRAAGFVAVQLLIKEQEPPKPSTRLSSSGERLTHIAKHRGITPEQLHREVRGDLDWIVMKALEKDRSRRYDTASSFAADVERYLRDDEVEARPPSTSYRLKKFVRRNLALVSTIATIGAVLIVATAVSAWQASQANMERDNARAAKDDALNKQHALEATLNQLHSALVDLVQLEMGAGDEERVRTAIQNAEMAGVPPETIQLFRGELALFYGRPAEAVAHLTPARDRSIAALALLVIAHLHAGDLVANERALQELGPRLRAASDLSQLDRLFAAWALMDEDYKQKHELVQGVLEERDSPLARMIVARVLAAYANETRDLDVMKQSIRHLEAALAFGANVPSFVEGEMMVRGIAVSLGVPTRVDFTDEELLSYQAKVSGHPMGRSGLIRLLGRTGDRRVVGLIASYVSDATELEATYYVPILLEHTSPTRVLEWIESNKSTAPYVLCMKARIMALIPELRESSRVLCERLIEERTDSYFRAQCLINLLLAGDSEHARKLASQLTATSTESYWYSTETLKHIAGDSEAGEFLANCENRIDELSARFALGSEQLGQGNLELAVEHFRWCQNASIAASENYFFAKAFLSAIEQKLEWMEQNYDADGPGSLRDTVRKK
jgi:serine/threonine protein kinase